MKKIFLYLVVCFPLHLFAQHHRTPVEYNSAIHFNPFALAQIDYTFLTGIEFRTNPRVSVVTELGYIFASDYIELQSKSFPASGFMIRPSVRFFMNERKNFYLQPQVFFKKVTHHLHDWVGMDCENDVPGYEEFKEFRFQRFIYGFNVTGGFLVPLSKSGNTLIDFYFGFGLRQKSVSIKNEPNACYNRRNFFVSISQSNGMVPGIPSGIKLIFVVR